MRRALTICCAVSAIMTGLPAGTVHADVGGSVPGMTIHTVKGWVAMSGSSLKDTLEGWGRVAGWTVVWDSDTDYILGASASFPGTFEEAVGGLIDSIYINNPEINAKLHSGNNVLRIQSQALSSN